MNRRVFVIALAVLVLASGVGLLLFLAFRSSRTELPPSQRIELVRWKNEALGYLDNGDYEKAVPILQRIVEAVPWDPLGRRNLVIALFAPNDQGHGGVKDNSEAMTALLDAVSAMLGAEPNSPAAHLLAGRVYRDQADKLRKNREEMQRLLRLARGHFLKAADLSPDDPAPHYDLYQLEADFVDPDRLTIAGLNSLTAAARRVPNNLRAQVELAFRQAEVQLPEVRGTLEKVLNLIPVEERLAREELTKALQLLPPGIAKPPQEVMQHVFAARNLLQQQPVFLDGLRELWPHPLTFLVAEFESEFTAGLIPEAETVVEVSFVPRPLPETVNQSRESDRALVAARFADLRGNGRLHWVLLRGGKELANLITLDASGKETMPSVTVPGSWSGFLLADLDLDIVPQAEGNLPADLDLILYGPDGLRIFEQTTTEAGPGWKDRTADAQLPPLRQVRWLTACDVDHDGNLDLVVGTATGTHILRNSGNWQFFDITDRTPDLAGQPSSAGVFGDFDRDGDLDLYLLTDSGLILLDNLRGGRFRLVQVPDVKAVSLAAADLNNDGLLDLVLGSESGVSIRLGQPGRWPHESGRVSSVNVGSGVKGLSTLDYDNDGWLDLVLETGEEKPALRFLRNRSGQTWSEPLDLLPQEPGRALPPDSKLGVLQIVDVDEDGDLDLLTLSSNKLVLLDNQGGNQNRWLRLRIRAMLNRDVTAVGRAARVNYYGIGSTIEIRSGIHYALQPVTDTETHFGLGSRRQVETARVVWTNGVPQVVIRPPTDAVITEEQRPKGSCPSLYAWTNQGFNFVTDCLWSSALGMKLAEGVEMGHERQNNYLIIRDWQLQPRENRYVLQFANELWEVPYLDLAEFWVVDHPAEYGVFTNQRIPPRDSENFRFVFARERRAPLAARDQTGRDVLPVIRERDGVFLGGFERRRYVGLAEPHHLELDLGDLSQARSATLFLTGWVWPTDTSANVAISRDSRFRGPAGVVGGTQPPELLVPDGNGGWTSLGVVGFPSGKMQTLAVPLPLDRFPDNDYRVRIATSMEIYWDEVFFSTDDPPAESVPLKVHRLKPADADLHFRGYGRPYQTSPIGPHLYSYFDVDRRPIWKPIPGPYTRYGSVTELLLHADDRYVVMAPGDELTMEWEAVPPPPGSWKRTYVFVASGWLKDFDLNGTSSESAGPLPFAGMSRYPYSPPEAHPHPTFIERYMTREPDVQRFWEMLRPMNPQRSNSR
ncbi:MAG: FG-GAP-like repeat-containing protein [Gemmatales bacterium]|nr:FG-GAP-like repeat-containing protein [Gemmatales bacterium]MDW8387401.1 FG-GAP-like repeat-containing protein [Gemmatales bacterium]